MALLVQLDPLRPLCPLAVLGTLSHNPIPAILLKSFLWFVSVGFFETVCCVLLAHIELTVEPERREVAGATQGVPEGLGSQLPGGAGHTRPGFCGTMVPWARWNCIGPGAALRGQAGSGDLGGQWACVGFLP